MAKKETRKCVKQTRHNDSVLRMFVGFVLHESWRVHSTHQDVAHFERAQAYPEYMVENCAHARKGGKCEQQLNEGCRPFIFQHRLKRQFHESCQKPPGTCHHVQNQSGRQRKRTHATASCANASLPRVKESRWQQQTGANGRSVRPKRRETSSRQRVGKTTRQITKESTRV